MTTLTSLQTIIYNGIASSEVGGSYITADTPSLSNGDWAIGWTQLDFHTNGAFAIGLLRAALTATQDFNPTEVNTIVSAFSSGGGQNSLSAVNAQLATVNPTLTVSSLGNMFFFEKKNQKTVIRLPSRAIRNAGHGAYR
jgi:hypothetical protein